MSGSAVERSVSAGLSLGTVFYGIHFTIFCSTVYHLHNSKREGKIPVWFHASTWITFVLGTMNIICATAFVHKTWIGGQHTVGGPLKWMQGNYADPTNVIANASVPLLFLLQDTILLYRLNTIYAFCRFRVLMVIIFSLSIIVSSTHTLLVTLAFFQLIQPTISPWFTFNVEFASIHCALSASVNVLMTIAIAGRMLYLRRGVIKDLGASHAKLYTSIAAMFVESGAIYSTLTFLCSLHVSRILGKEFQSVVFLALVQAPGICTDLIAIRIARGYAWSQATAPRSLPRMRFTDVSELEKSDEHVRKARYSSKFENRLEFPDDHSSGSSHSAI